MKNNEKLFNIGSSEILITPNVVVDLYTLDGKIRKRGDVYSDLTASAVVINDNYESIIVVSLDLIWIDRNFSSNIQDWVDSQYVMSGSKVLLVATHSHSTPQISSKISNTARPNLVYLKFLHKNVCKLITNAWSNQVKCYAEMSVSNPNLAVNRRKKILNLESIKKGFFKTMVANRPNYKGTKDDLLYSVWFYNDNGDEKAVLLNYACHPSLFRKNAVSSDYPGEVRKYLQDQVSKKLTVCFLQGFAGNIKANIVGSPCSISIKNIHICLYSYIFDRIQFNKNIPNSSIKNFSKKLGICAISRKKKISITPKITFTSRTISLPLRENNNSVNLDFYYVSIGDILKIALFGGEMFSEYSIWMRKYLAHKNHYLLTVGYCNDIVGYIPTMKSINEGGYEVERTSDFSQASSFSDKIEKIIKNEFKKIIDK